MTEEEAREVQRIVAEALETDFRITDVTKLAFSNADDPTILFTIGDYDLQVEISPVK